MKLYLYILKETLSIFFLALLVFTALFILSRFSRFTDLFLQRGVEIKDILLLFFYASFSYLTFSLPMAFLLSCLVVLGRLSHENEIFILKVAGINLRHLFVPYLFFACCIGILNFMNTSFFLSKSTEKLEGAILNTLKKSFSLEEKEGIFNDSIPGIVIYVDRTEGKVYRGILISDERDERVKQIITAQKGEIKFSSSSLDLYFDLKNGSLHRWEKDKDTYRSFSFKNYAFSFNLSSLFQSAKILKKRVYEMSYHELKERIKIASEKERYELLFELYNKFSLSLSPVAFTFLIVPIGVRRKGGRVSGLLLSLSLFLFFYLLLALCERIGERLNFSPFFMAFLPTYMVAFSGLLMTRDLNGEKRFELERLKRFIGI